jgi:hypothetical protein
MEDAAPPPCAAVVANAKCDEGDPVVVTNEQTECGAKANCRHEGNCAFRCQQRCGVEGSHKCDGQLSLKCQDGVFITEADCTETGSRCDPNGGTCERCGPNQKRCNNVCTDINTDTACGDCGESCDQTDVNLDNHCIESSPGSGSFHCSQRCKDGLVFVGGKCAIECPPGSGLEPCNNVCVDQLRDPEHCGGCSPAPADTSDPNSAPACTNGTPDITCKNGYTKRCGSPPKCVDTTSDTQHCGACGIVCNAANGNNACLSGTCKPTCDSTHADCDGNPNNGCEQDATQDAKCGAGCMACTGTFACAPVNGSYKCASCEERGLVTCGAACVEPFLSGFAYRVAIPIVNGGGALSDFQVRFTLDTQSRIAAGKMAANAADLRLTAGDGLTPLSFWASPATVNTTTTAVWVRIASLPPGSTKIFAYYGNSGATSASDIGTTFVNAFTDPTFKGNGSWRQLGPTNGGSSTYGLPSQSYPDSCLGTYLSRSPDPNGSGLWACQSASFPGGSNYQLVFDVDLQIATQGVAAIELDASRIWSSRNLGSTRDTVTTLSVMPGVGQLCVGVYAEGGAGSQGILAFYRNLRARKIASPEPSVGAPGVETVKCP